MKLSDMFAKRLVTAAPKDSLALVTMRMQEHNVGSVVVVDGKMPVGIVTDRDIALALGAESLPVQTPVEKVMTRAIRTLSQDAGIFNATLEMRNHGVRRLPIVDNENRLVGIVTHDDLVRFLGREFHNLCEGIRQETQAK